MGKKGENREKTNIAAVEKKAKIGGLGGSRGQGWGINRVGNVENVEGGCFRQDLQDGQDSVLVAVCPLQR